MLLSCIILVKLEKIWLSKILGMTYNLERREYATCPQGVSKKKNRKKRKRKYSPYQKKFIREKIHMKEFHPPSTKNIHTLTHLDQGLWLVSSLDPVFNLAKYEKQVCHHILHTYKSTKKKPLEVVWKKKGA